MNTALTWLLLTRIKNGIRRFIRKPSRLILAVIIIALIGFTIFAGHLDDAENPVYRDVRELAAIALVFYAFIFLLTAYNGFTKGASLFSMSDVNLLFPSPLPQQSVLFYGLVQQLGTSLLVGFFLLFQYTTLHTTYGISYAGLLWLLLGYGLTLFCGQLAAMTLYVATAGSERRRSIAKAVFFAVLGILAAVILLYLFPHRSELLPRAVSLAVGPLAWFPIAGWLSAMVHGCFTGNLPQILLPLAASAVFVAALILWLVRSKADYYEDVLGITETKFRTAQAAKSGRITETPVKARRGGTLNRGEGASVIYYKHLLENRRSNPLFLEPSQWIFIVCAIVFTLFIRQRADPDAGGTLLGCFIFSVYLRMFGTALGRLPKELLRPYIYLIPETSFRKLFWAMAEALPKFALISVLMYLPISLLCGVTVPEAILCMAAGFSFDCLFLSGFLLTERLFSSVTSKVFSMIFYMITLIVLTLPGIVLAVVLRTAGVVLVSPTFTMFLALTAVNIPMALLAVFLSRNILDNVEVNQQ